MDINKLKLAQELAEKIEEREADLNQLRHILSDAYLERTSYFNYFQDDSIRIPESIFKRISHLIFKTIEEELNVLKTEFESL